MTALGGLLNWDSTEQAITTLIASNPLASKLKLLAAGEPLILVRNWYGQLTLLVPCSRVELERSQVAPLIDAMKLAAGELALESWTLCRDELFDAASYWQDPSLIELLKLGELGQTLTLMLLERQDKEKDWLTPPTAQPAMSSGVKRCVFFSVKGGVGRSSALTMLAIKLASSGKRVLVVDGDFESPGVSSSLLPAGEGQPDYGVVDWLTAQALGATDAELEHMALTSTASPCPLNALLNLQGQILVSPAYGRKTEAYVAKLARTYRRSPAGKSYAQRLNEFLAISESQHKVDVTLFDCRAGIDDTAAVAITQLLADISFLFAINTGQTWDSYRLLFKHLKRNVALFANVTTDEQDEAWDLRRSMRLVSALTPQEAGAYLGYSDALQENAYDTFSEIYDEDSGEDSYTFSPAPEDTNAPHSALSIQWVDALRAFSPLTEPSQITDPLNQAAFSNFITRAMTLLGVEDEFQR